MQDPTLQTATPEKLERKYLLRERKQPQRFYWSYLNYENCSRHLHTFLLVHDVIVVLGFYFFLTYISRGGICYVPYFANAQFVRCLRYARADMPLMLIEFYCSNSPS